jgi:FMN reductase
VILGVVGNPRRESRTHGLARTLVGSLARVLPGTTTGEVDLAILGPRVLDPRDRDAIAATDRVRAANLLVVASPTYKATYSGLLKAFLDRLDTGALNGAAAIPILLGGAQNHHLAVDVHMTPLLLELGARVPARGLFVVESELDEFPAQAAAWAAEQRDVLRAYLGRQAPASPEVAPPAS